MIVRTTRKEESKRVNELFAIAFELPVEDGPAEEKENPKVHHWAAFEDESNEMMSTFSISDFSIQFDGHSCKMGGIGGVATLPQYRRKGGIRGCFQASLPDMFKNNYDFSYLYPFSTAYYRKFGYECCVQKMAVTINLSLLKPGEAAGTVCMCEAKYPMTDSITAIDREAETRYNMMVRHQAEDYQWTAEFDPAGKQEFTYVYFDTDHSPKAYTTFRKVDQSDGRNLVCSRMVFLNQEGFHGLMHLFKSLSADHMYVKFSLPITETMEYLFPEWTMGAAAWTIQNAGMVRIINVENVLKKAKYIGSGCLTIAIHDGQISENNGTFRISFENGKSTAVEKTNSQADAEMEISTFSALLSGVTQFHNAVQWMSGLKVQNNNACFDQIFYRKPLMIVDYF